MLNLSDGSPIIVGLVLRLILFEATAGRIDGCQSVLLRKKRRGAGSIDYPAAPSPNIQQLRDKSRKKRQNLTWLPILVTVWTPVLCCSLNYYS